MADHSTDDPPSPFVAHWAAALAARWSEARALDVAMGRGRHARVLAALGYRTFGVDIRVDAVRSVIGRARTEGLVVRGWCADLTTSPLPCSRFELVVVSRYLQRSLFEALRDSIVAGGAVIYETFTINQRRLGVGPTSPDHLLHPGELRERFGGFDVLFYEETRTPEAVARIVATKRG
jgi:SAM-dependent methyltransferase